MRPAHRQRLRDFVEGHWGNVLLCKSEAIDLLNHIDRAERELSAANARADRLEAQLAEKAERVAFVQEGIDRLIARVDRAKEMTG